MWGNIAIAFLIAFIVSMMLTPYTIRIAEKIGAVDVPKDKRRMHTREMPKFGGPAVIIGFVISVIYLLIVMSIEGSINLFTPEQYGVKIIGVFLGIIAITIVGVIDDIKTLNPICKLLGQVIAATIAVIFGIRIEQITIPFLYKIGLSEAFSVLVTIIWIVGISL